VLLGGHRLVPHNNVLCQSFCAIKTVSIERAELASRGAADSSVVVPFPCPFSRGPRGLFDYRAT
jgi:hypothetical protein